jgi:serine/threonine protein kinase
MLMLTFVFTAKRQQLHSIVFPQARLTQNPQQTDALDDDKPQSALIFERVVGFTLANRLVDFKDAALQHLTEIILLMHGQGVIHMDLYPGNVKLEITPEGTLYAVKLIDFDAAMFIGRLMPSVARGLLERNGQSGIYHPDAFKDNAAVHVCFDWWLFAMLEAGAPFGAPFLAA